MTFLETEALCILDPIPKKKIVGIGIHENPEKVFLDILTFTGPCSIVPYVSHDLLVPADYPGLVMRSDHPEEHLISDLFSGNIHAAVRGSFEAGLTLRLLKTIAGVDELERIVLLETINGNKFFLAPVGIDEGWSVDQKISFIEKGRRLCKKFGLPDTVSVLSGGRLSDKGRHPVVDKTLDDAALISNLTGAVNLGILIEDAVQTSGLIIAPDGISGNLIFRTILFLGRGRSHGAPVINIRKTFIDTSRVNPDYHFALNLACALADESFF